MAISRCSEIFWGRVLAGLLCMWAPEEILRGEEARKEATFQRVEELHAEGLHNLFRVSERLYSGSQPEGETGFESLKKLGIRTVISVDGARPEIELAHRQGMKYVHLPIGYDGIPRQTMLKLAKAAQILPGPIYIHCHHGKHRGPAATAAIALCNDKTCRTGDAVKFMQQAQTDPKYKGLYAVPRAFQPPAAEELAAVVAEFPEVVEVDDLTGMMTRIDHEFETLAPLALGKVPEDRSGMVQGALLLNEHFREAERLPEAAQHSAEYRRDLKESVELSDRLHRLLSERGSASADLQKVAKAIKGTCMRCHERDRDNL